jgi:hypothetical protein
MQNQPSNEALSVRADEKTVIASSPSSSAGHYDPLADLVVRRWWDAVRWSQSETIDNYSIEQSMAMCDRQRRGVYEAADAELLGGIDIFIPATNMKCMAAEAWLRDMLASVIQMPWIAEPTPLPELPARLRQKALRDLKFEIVSAATGGNPIVGAQALARMPPQLADLTFGQMISHYPGDLEEKAKQLKETARQLSMAEARKAAKNMNRLMRDQSIQLGMGTLNHQLFYDLVTYPIAIIKGPVLTSRPRIVWSGNSQTVKKTAEIDAYRVSPFDLKPSPDSPDTQRGTFVCERISMTKRDLRRARGQKFWITESIDNLMYAYADRSRNWLVENTSYNPELTSPLGLWTEDESIVGVEHHGIVSGDELRPYGFSLDAEDYYEARIVVAGYRTLMVKVSGSAFVTPRPYHATSYEKRGERFYGTCPTLKMRDTQRSLNAAFRAKIRNMGFSSGPQVEADVSRLKGYVTRLEELLDLSPYAVKFADPDLINGGRPAYTFTNVPQIIGPLLALVKYYMTLMDDVSNIPNYAQGDTSLGSAGRTYRGFSAVFAQALKVFKMPVQNLDDGIYAPFGAMLYNHNVAYSDDPTVKGDCRVNARGSQGLVDKETEEQKSLDRMGVIGQIVPALAQADPESARKMVKVLEWSAAKAMEGLGIPIGSFGFDPDVTAALAEEDDFESTQEPIPSIGATPSPQ